MKINDIISKQCCSDDIESIDIADRRFKNVVIKKDDGYYLTTTDIKIDNIFLLKENNNKYLRLFPFDYYLVISGKNFYILKTLTKLRETPEYITTILTDYEFFYGDISNITLNVYNNILIVTGYDNNKSYLSFYYMLFDKNITSQDILECAESDIVCNDIKYLTDFLTERRNIISSVHILPDGKNNKISLTIYFNQKEGMDNKEFKFIFKHNNSKYIKLKLKK